MKEVDYSDRAVTMRIRQVSQLRRLCLSLGRSTPAGPPPPPPTKPQPC